MAQLISLFLALFVLVLPAQAQNMEFRFSGQDRLKTDPFILGISKIDDGSIQAAKRAYLDIRWQTEIKMGLLMGDPVVSIRLKFTPLAGVVTMPMVTDRGIRYGTMNFNQLTDKMVQNIRLNDFRLQLTFLTKTGGRRVETVYLKDSVGSTRAPNEWSFNVPSGFNWDELLIARSFKANDFVPPLSAKKMWENGLELHKVDLIGAELNFYHLHDYYMRTYDSRETYRIHKLSYERIAEGLKRSYGIDINRKFPDKAWTDAPFQKEDKSKIASPQDWRERARGLGKYLGKLSQLPAELRIGDNHGPYNKAVEDYEALINTLEFTYLNFQAAGVDTKDLKQGSEPRFDDVGGYDIRIVSRKGHRYSHRAFTLVDAKGRVVKRLKIKYGLERPVNNYFYTRRYNCRFYNEYGLRIGGSNTKRIKLEKFQCPEIRLRARCSIYASEVDHDSVISIEPINERFVMLRWGDNNIVEQTGKVYEKFSDVPEDSFYFHYAQEFKVTWFPPCTSGRRSKVYIYDGNFNFLRSKE